MEKRKEKKKKKNEKKEKKKYNWTNLISEFVSFLNSAFTLILLISSHCNYNK